MEPATQKQEMKKCPACAELILADAIKCKHCGERLSEATAAAKSSGGTQLVAVPSGMTTAGAILGTSITTILYWISWAQALAISEGHRPGGGYAVLGLFAGVISAVGVGMLLGQFMRGFYPAAFAAGRAGSALWVVAGVYTAILLLLGEGVAAATEFITMREKHHTALAIICFIGGPAATFLAAKLTRKGASSAAS